MAACTSSFAAETPLAMYLSADAAAWSGETAAASCEGALVELLLAAEGP
jgi:hypothetical protein